MADVDGDVDGSLGGVVDDVMSERSLPRHARLSRASRVAFVRAVPHDARMGNERRAPSSVLLLPLHPDHSVQPELDDESLAILARIDGAASIERIAKDSGIPHAMDKIEWLLENGVVVCAPPEHLSFE
jgi:hypothetical protein